jgi:excisionase family DNA binding protein
VISIERVPYNYIPPDELRRRIARTLYAEQQLERPDWIDEQLLRPGQVAALFQVSRRTISDWARAGKLDAIITPGGHRRFRATQVRELFESQKVEATVPAIGSLQS